MVSSHSSRCFSLVIAGKFLQSCSHCSMVILSQDVQRTYSRLFYKQFLPLLFASVQLVGSQEGHLPGEKFCSDNSPKRTVDS